MSNNRYDLAASQESPIRNAARLLYVSTAKYGGDWHSVPHTHACAELFYVVGGQGQIRIEDQLHPVSADDLVIVNPNVEHTEVSLNANPLEYIVLGVEGLELSVSSEEDDRFCIVSFRGCSEDMLFCLRSMLREIEGHQLGFESVCQDFLEILVVRLMRRSNFTSTLTPTHHPSKGCTAVRRYIDGHFKENLNLDMLAQVAQVNKYHMVHAFSSEYGISPMNYLISRRIQESCYLLRSTNHSMSQIAQMLGFSSPSYFSQTFRKLEGVSPMEYRRSSRSNTGTRPAESAAAGRK